MQGRRITELEADNAQLSVEVTSLRLRPRLPQPSAALNQLVGALGLHEQDLRVRAGVHLPRYLALCTDACRRTRGCFAVTVPTGTTTVAGDAFTWCEGLAQVCRPLWP